MSKIILLDRDEVINKSPSGKKYLLSSDELILIDKNIKGLSFLADQGFKFIVITNQRCINLNLLSEQELNYIHIAIKTKLYDEFNIDILDFYFCPHLITENCKCRKPRSGLVSQAIEDYGLSSDTLMIGDQITDCFAALGSGLYSMLIKNKFFDEELDLFERHLGAYEDIFEAKDKILEIYS